MDTDDGETELLIRAHVCLGRGDYEAVRAMLEPRVTAGTASETARRLLSEVEMEAVRRASARNERQADESMAPTGIWAGIAFSVISIVFVSAGACVLWVLILHYRLRGHGWYVLEHPVHYSDRYVPVHVFSPLSVAAVAVGIGLGGLCAAIRAFAHNS